MDVGFDDARDDQATTEHDIARAVPGDYR